MLRRLLILLLLVALAAGAWLLVPNEQPDVDQRELAAALGGVRALLTAPAASAEDVSAWSTRQHAEHLVLANEGILAAIEGATAPETVEPLSVMGRLVLRSGSIPRGKGQAPESTVPAGTDAAGLLARLTAQEAQVAALDPAAVARLGVVANHPVFGGMTGAQWLRLASIHTRHHLAITDDIVAAGARPAD